MFIERAAFNQGKIVSVKELRDACIGCKDCKGLCRELLEISQVPDMLLELQETRA
jgi:CO dehydrogenase/acetyl-CoA synthase alpha subunit